MTFPTEHDIYKYMQFYLAQSSGAVHFGKLLIAIY